jgi:hypothetical protein
MGDHKFIILSSSVLRKAFVLHKDGLWYDNDDDDDEEEDDDNYDDDEEDDDDNDDDAVDGDDTPHISMVNLGTTPFLHCNFHFGRK